MVDFAVITITPIELDHPGLAVATARAGGIAVLDREHCPAEKLAQARSNLKQLLERVNDDAVVGLRLRIDQLEQSKTLLELLHGRPHWLILNDVCSLPIDHSRKLLLEITNAKQTVKLPSDVAIHGLVARGNETGGWVGPEPAFILSQKLLATQQLPVYVQGGIGLHTAAACRAAGAAGVILDDQLLLMPESPLPHSWASSLAKLTGHESILIGETLEVACRFLSRPGLKAAAELQHETLYLQPDQESRWREKARTLLGWNPPEKTIWPIGQAIGLADHFKQKFGTTGKLIQAISASPDHSLRLARELRPLAPESALAASHQTRYPIVQGPMTRVSDTARFANAVASSGALPLVALALMKYEEARKLLRETSELLGERSWGVGILGFVPPELREQQLKAVREVHPRFALIAGGRPDQSTQLTEAGIATYIHVPTGGLLKSFLAKGARRFVFEGRECGGHVGPLTSFVLWETVIETLLHEVTEHADEIHVLFAGGIHDARSAAMVSAMAAPLTARGMHVGVLMGTAYLFTREAVASGAIVESFQQQALNCETTDLLETGPGHSIRCVDTPFAREFHSAKRAAMESGLSPSQLKETLEGLTVGRLRIASKGLQREAEQLVSLSTEQQVNEGVYMIGQVATMRDHVHSMAELHADVSERSQDFLDQETAPVQVTSSAKKSSDIAIVGIGLLVPGAQEPAAFWNNIVHRVNSISEIPPERWDWRLFFDEDRKQSDKIYSRWGGFIDDVPFDPLQFGIAPKSLKSISCSQLLALEVVRRALADAGYESREFDRENTSIILGSADAGSLVYNALIARTMLPLLVESSSSDVLQRLPEWTGETFPGTLANITAGRVANRFDLGGANFTVDAACASSLAAIDIAVTELESGRCNMAISGGVDFSQSPYFYIAFSKTQALSPRGQALTFDKSADGIVISEGAAVLVLKRRADAERDGDRIYAVIKSVASSSDGRALGLTAPRPIGQRRAIERAKTKANISLDSLGLYEAHGTGTVVGDQAELETIITSLNADNAASNSCAIGSIKTLVGHTKMTAGVVGLTKAVLSLYHKVLPPHWGVKEPLDPISDTRSPVYLLNEARPWLAHPEHARRSGVSAFGFGGTNSHALLEEYADEVGNRAPGGSDWPFELIVFSADDRAELRKQVSRLRDAVRSRPQTRLRDLAFTAASSAQTGAVRISIVAETVTRLEEDLNLALSILDGKQQQLPAHIVLNTIESTPGKVAFCFPGQGSQYTQMARELALYFNELRETLETSDALLKDCYPHLLSQYIYPPAAFSEAEQSRQSEALTATHVAQPAIGAISAGLLRIIERLGINASMACGHSYGEYTALFASGALSLDDFIRLSEVRGRVMGATNGVAGGMAAIAASRDDVAAMVAEFPSVVIANHNSPSQIVISGAVEDVKEMVARLNRGRMLPVSEAFHSPLMEHARLPLANAIAACAWRSPSLPVYSNVTARPYDTDVESLTDQISQHLLSTVEFVAQMERMYADGARVFIEVGPRNILTGLIGQIFKGRPHLALPLAADGGGIREFLIALARLFSHGVDFQVASLFSGRDVRLLDLNEHTLSNSTQAAPKPAWVLTGAGVRQESEELILGNAPFLTKDHRRAAPVPEAIRSNGSSHSQPAVELPSAGQLPGGHVVAAYQAYQETMRQFLSLQEEALKQFLGTNGDFSGAIHTNQGNGFSRVDESHAHGNGSNGDRESAAIVPTIPEPQQPSANTVMDRERLTQMVLHIVKERTGYPEEMLALDMDIEAELGIDSIKRIEILEALQSVLPSTLTAKVQQSIDQLTRVKSLNELVDRLSEWLGAAAPVAEITPPAPVESPAAKANEESFATGCPRAVFEPRVEPIQHDSAQLPAGLFVVTQDEMSVASPLAEELRACGATVAFIPKETLASPDQLAQAIRELSAREPVTGIIHLAGLSTEEFPDDLEKWRLSTQLQTKSLFQLLRKTHPHYVLSASLLGGMFGRNGECGPALPGGNNGLLKTLATEWPGLVGKAIDFDRTLSAQEMASRLMDELLANDPHYEVGYPSGQRTVFRVTSSPLRSDAASLEPGPDWVVLATGGARGITAAVAHSLAQPGMTIILAGRTPLHDEPDDIAAVEDVSELRRLLTARNGKSTPAQIERELQSFRNQREIKRNLALLAQAGVNVEYKVVDVKDGSAFAELIEEVYARYGRIDAVLHGAGIIEDKLLSDKSSESFDRVFDTKSDSTFILARHLRPSSLKLLALFSSVAAAVGNRGQCDYAAANEVMNRLAWRMATKFSKSRVVSINWGPWAGAGLASGAVNRQFKERGIIPIEMRDGVSFFMNEIKFGSRHDVEVIAGRGPWLSQPDHSGYDLGDLLLEIHELSEYAWLM